MCSEFGPTRSRRAAHGHHSTTTRMTLSDAKSREARSDCLTHAFLLLQLEAMSSDPSVPAVAASAVAVPAPAAGATGLKKPVRDSVLRTISRLTDVVCVSSRSPVRKQPKHRLSTMKHLPKR